MQLIDHVSIAVRDVDGAKRFYRAIFSALGAPVVYEQRDAIGFGTRSQPNDDAHTYLSVFQSPTASADVKRHWCFRASSRAQVDAFYAAGIGAGGTDAGAPGLRVYHASYYAAFLLDPEGNKVEAVYHRNA